MPEPSTIEYRDASAVAPTPEGYAGYAATFLTVDSYGTAFAPGAFRKTLKARRDRIPVLWQHDTDQPIGRHITLKEDRAGLQVDVALIDDGAAGTTALKRLRGGVPLGLSFGFQRSPGATRAATDDDGLDLSQAPGAKPNDIELITGVDLWETSVVTFPANELALITAVRDRAAGCPLGVDALAVISEVRDRLLDGSYALDDDVAAVLWEINGVLCDWDDRKSPIHRAALAARLTDSTAPDPSALPDPGALRARRDRELAIAGVLARARFTLGGVAP